MTMTMIILSVTGGISVKRFNVSRQPERSLPWRSGIRRPTEPQPVIRSTELPMVVSSYLPSCPQLLRPPNVAFWMWTCTKASWHRALPIYSYKKLSYCDAKACQRLLKFDLSRNLANQMAATLQNDNLIEITFLQKVQMYFNFQGHQKWHQSKSSVWFPISTL